MQNAVLTSIQPPNTNNIFDGIKGIEWRTKPMPTGKHYVYETKNGGGSGKVVGECTMWRIKRYENVTLIPEEHISLGCVPIEFLREYSKGRPLYAHFIINPKRYDNPKELNEFRVLCREYDKERPMCGDCQYYHSESNECVGFYEDCVCCGLKPITRPPQSWCCVEELR